MGRSVRNSKRKGHNQKIPNILLYCVQGKQIFQCVKGEDLVTSSKAIAELLHENVSFKSEIYSSVFYQKSKRWFLSNKVTSPRNNLSQNYFHILMFFIPQNSSIFLAINHMKCFQSQKQL